MQEKNWAIGIDLGGTKIKAALVDSSGSIEKQILLETNVAGGPSSIERDILAMVRELQAATSFSINGVGIGVPGQINKEDLVTLAPNLQWQNVPLKSDLQKALNLPIAIENDVRMAAYGELFFGSAKQLEDVAFLFIGTGIGGTIISNGKVIKGWQNSAGELGHTIIVLNGRDCTCGNKGCLEAYSSGWAIAKQARELVSVKHTGFEPFIEETRGKIDQITAKLVIQLAMESNPLAKIVIAEATHALVGGGINIANALNPSHIIVGGGIVYGMPSVIQNMAEGIQKYALPPSRTTKVMIAELGDNSGIIGAASLWLNKSINL